jgi:hypothetical protein
VWSLSFREGPFFGSSEVRMGGVCDAYLALQPCPLLTQPLLDHLFKLGGGYKRGVAIAAILMVDFPRRSSNSFPRWHGVRHTGSLLSA